MGIIKEHRRYSRHITRTRRWKQLRLVVLDRDNWQCVRCGERRRLEVDHIKPVRTHPNLSFAMENLQALCGSCHTKKTRLEIGLKPLPPERLKWRNLLRDMQPKTNKQQRITHA